MAQVTVSETVERNQRGWTRVTRQTYEGAFPSLETAALISKADVRQAKEEDPTCWTCGKELSPPPSPNLPIPAKPPAEAQGPPPAETPPLPPSPRPVQPQILPSDRLMTQKEILCEAAKHEIKFVVSQCAKGQYIDKIEIFSKEMSPIYKAVMMLSVLSNLICMQAMTVMIISQPVKSERLMLFFFLKALEQMISHIIAEWKKLIPNLDGGQRRFYWTLLGCIEFLTSSGKDADKLALAKDRLNEMTVKHVGKRVKAVRNLFASFEKAFEDTRSVSNLFHVLTFAKADGAVEGNSKFASWAPGMTPAEFLASINLRAYERAIMTSLTVMTHANVVLFEKSLKYNMNFLMAVGTSKPLPQHIEMFPQIRKRVEDFRPKTSDAFMEKAAPVISSFKVNFDCISGIFGQLPTIFSSPVLALAGASAV